ncbi:MAG: transglycosylase domain-containing protein [Deltaproteobacteria bacterium]|nr:transglycosylase domain-containing protein [Deltaproteobacteria bacterium]
MFRLWNSTPGRKRVSIENPSDGGVLFWLGKLYGFVLASVVLTALAASLSTYVFYAASIGPVSGDREAHAAPSVTRIYAGDGTLLAELANQWREEVPLSAIPERLQRAFIATEDRRFYQHGGIDFRGILRAILSNVSSGQLRQGGSTITQQVAKMSLGSEKSFSRKAKEAVLARRMEAHLTKQQILERYLNGVFLGGGAYGVKAAAMRYFGKQLDELTLSETAMIAGLARAPGRDAPTRSLEAATRRRNEVLRAMAQTGVITEAERSAASADKIRLRKYKEVFGQVSPYFSEQVRLDLVAHYGRKDLYERGLRVETTVLPWVDAVAAENVDFATRKMDKRQGFRKTTRLTSPPDEEPGRVAHLSGVELDGFRQRAEARYGEAPLVEGRRYLGVVEEVAADGAKVRVGARSYPLPLSQMRWASTFTTKDATNDRTTGDARTALEVGDVIWVRSARRSRVARFTDWTYNEDGDALWMAESDKPTGPEGTLALEQTPRVQSAIFTFDHETGYVLAMAGGTDFDRVKYNQVTQACRQPGSTYKPIYYSLAMDKGFGFDSSWKDIPKTEVDPITGEVWKPTDLETPTTQEVTLEWSLVWSRNIPSVEIFNKLGASAVEAWARKLGFTTTIHADKALALGASCTYMDELSRAFSYFARNGRGYPDDLVYVRRIRDRNGHVLVDRTAWFDPDLSPADKLDRIAARGGVKLPQVIPARAAYLTNVLLRQAVDRGHAKPIRATPIVGAGKTGTSSATMDLWFTGYTARWYTTFWMGDVQRERQLGYHDASFMVAVPSWARYMNEVAVDQPQREIPTWVPEGVKPGDRGGPAKRADATGKTPPPDPDGT